MPISSEPEQIAALLPQSPPAGMMETVYADEVDSFGGNLIIYHRVPYIKEPELKRTMTPADWAEYERNTRRCWAAECHCTACGEVFMAGWAAGGDIMITVGDDGMTYDGVPEPDDESTLLYEEGFAMPCPSCMAYATLIRKSRIHDQWSNQLMICSVENAGKYTALVWWLERRTLFADGDYEMEINPIYAAVILPGGALSYFRCSKYSEGGRVWPSYGDWEPCGRIEPDQTRYYDRDANAHNLVGAIYWRKVPDQLGQTGEKTGLADYIRDGGRYPLQYLRWWQGHPEIENLIKAGWTPAITSSIENEVDNSLAYGRGKVHLVADLGELFNWGAVRPCDLLTMEKEEEQKAREWRWNYKRLALWSEMIDYGIAGPGCAETVEDAINQYGFENILTWESYVIDGWDDWNLNKFDRYLKRQERRHGLALDTGFQMLMDYRLMLPADAPNEELWPANLRAAHDALGRTVDLQKAEKLGPGFAMVLDKWAGLEWSDGKICIRLPRGPQELTTEGRTLNHCVGRYGENHIREDIILFVRHTRRPERSWFTLNINLTGKDWREIQLHGDGNEWSPRGKRLHIPKQVRDFVDCWEKEVLTPVFRQVKAAEAKAEKKPRKKKEKAA